MTTYRMTQKGGTRGAVSNRPHSWRRGQIIEAPDGEFAHLSASAYEVIKPEKPAPEKAEAPEAPEKAVKPRPKKRKTTKKS